MIAAEAVSFEPPDFNGALFLHRLLLLIEFLGMPFLLVWAFLEFLGPLSFVLGLLGLYVFFKFLSPSNLLALLGIFRLLSPTRRSREEQIPVQYVRVRDREEQEHIVRRKGHLYGHLMPGDEVALWGRWRRGVLDLRRGLNLRTGSPIVVRTGRSRSLLLLHLVILAMLIALFLEPLSHLLARLTP